MKQICYLLAKWTYKYKVVKMCWMLRSHWALNRCDVCSVYTVKWHDVEIFIYAVVGWKRQIHSKSHSFFWQKYTRKPKLKDTCGWLLYCCGTATLLNKREERRNWLYSERHYISYRGRDRRAFYSEVWKAERVIRNSTVMNEKYYFLINTKFIIWKYLGVLQNKGFNYYDFKSGQMLEKHAVVSRNVLEDRGKPRRRVSSLAVAVPSGYWLLASIPACKRWKIPKVSLAVDLLIIELTCHIQCAHNFNYTAEQTICCVFVFVVSQSRFAGLAVVIAPRGLSIWSSAQICCGLDHPP
jgi:hypothetical protein